MTQMKTNIEDSDKQQYLLLSLHQNNHIEQGVKKIWTPNNFFLPFQFWTNSSIVIVGFDSSNLIHTYQIENFQ
jgi:hypothetical protein